MDIIVLGAGVIGMTTAYQLAKSGHKVKVIDMNEEPAMECSFANGAQLSFSHVEPICSSVNLSNVIKSSLSRNSFMNINQINKATIDFSRKLVKNSSKSKSQQIASNLYKITNLSKSVFDEIFDTHKINFNFSRSGILHFFHSEKAFGRAKEFAKFQNDIGCKSAIYNVVECVEKEPTLIKLVESHKLKGGIFYPDDATGNPNLFCKELYSILKNKFDVKFIFNEEIKNIFTDSKKITGVHTQTGVYRADRYVYCLGSFGIKFLTGIDVNLDILPVLGGSISVNVKKSTRAPSMGLTDSENRLVYSRIGNVFRAAGAFAIKKTPEVSDKINNFIKNKIKYSFSSCGEIDESVFWQNFRPMRPNSTPLISFVKKFPNLIINSGHGHLGWTMSCGSAEITRRLIDNDNLKEFDFLEEVS